MVAVIILLSIKWKIVTIEWPSKARAITLQSQHRKNKLTLSEFSKNFGEITASPKKLNNIEMYD